MVLGWMWDSESRGTSFNMRKKVIVTVIALLVLAGLTAKFAVSRSNISLNESALYPEDI
jgi:hypothetical protein